MGLSAKRHVVDDDRGLYDGGGQGVHGRTEAARGRSRKGNDDPTSKANRNDEATKTTTTKQPKPRSRETHARTRFGPSDRSGQSRRVGDMPGVSPTCPAHTIMGYICKEKPERYKPKTNPSKGQTKFGQKPV